MSDVHDSHEQAEARRERLRTLMDRLEAALAAPPRRNLAEWRHELQHVIADLQDELEVHIAGTEGAGGLFEEVAARAPRLRNAISRLRHDHPALQASLTRLAGELEPVEFDDAAIERIRRHGSDLLIDLISHRQRGADLLYEAYWVDISLGD